jgi:hypothetical protein
MTTIVLPIGGQRGERRDDDPGSVRQQHSFAEQVKAGSSVHLPLEHLIRLTLPSTGPEAVLLDEVADDAVAGR